jgi:hypothetical protein
VFLLTLPHIAHASRVSGGCEAAIEAQRPRVTREPWARGSGGRDSASELPGEASLLLDGPKWLTGPNQTVSGWTCHTRHGTPAGRNSRRGKGRSRPSTHLVIAELGKPHGVSTVMEALVLQADRKGGLSPQGVADVGGSEGRLVLGRITGHPVRRKAADFPRARRGRPARAASPRRWER